MAELTADAGESPQESPSALKRLAQNLGWFGFFFGLLIVFTIVKMPGDKIHAYVQAQVAQGLSREGIGFTAESGGFDLGFGVGYRFEGVTLTPRPPAQPVRLSSLRAQPAILQLLSGRLGGRVTAETGGGTIDVAASMPKPGASGRTEASFELQDVDLGKSGIFGMLGGIQGKAVAKGDGALQGDPQDPKTLNGDLKLDLQKIVVNEQSLYGFKIPQLSISNARIDLQVTEGRAAIKTFQIGKEGSNDDFIATLTGDLMLRGGLANPDLQIKAKFKISDKVKQAFTLIDALLGAGRQPDGSYAYTISGPLSGPPTVQPGI